MLYYGSFFFFPHKSRIKMTHLMSGSLLKMSHLMVGSLHFFFPLHKSCIKMSHLMSGSLLKMSHLMVGSFFFSHQSRLKMSHLMSGSLLKMSHLMVGSLHFLFSLLPTQESYKDVPSYVWLPTKDVPSYGRIIFFSFHQSHIKMSHLMARSLYILFFLHTRVV